MEEILTLTLTLTSKIGMEEIQTEIEAGAKKVSGGSRVCLYLHEDGRLLSREAAPLPVGTLLTLTLTLTLIRGRTYSGRDLDGARESSHGEKGGCLPLLRDPCMGIESIGSS